MLKGGIALLFALLLAGVVHSSTGRHIHRTAFTYTTGMANHSEPMGVTFIDEVQIARYDSRNRSLGSTCSWVRTAMKSSWENYNDFCTSAYQMLAELKECVGKKEDVRVFQWTSSCIYDDQKGTCEGYERYGFDGEDFISLKVPEMKYIPHKKEAENITDLWKNQPLRINFVRYRYTKELPAYLKSAAPYLKTAVVPDVYLLQRNSSSPLMCLATGFNSSAVMMIWQRNGQDLHEDVEEGHTLPNGDGTFQKRISLRAETEEWKKNTYRCVVQHENWETSVIRNVTENEIKTNSKPHPHTGRAHVAIIIIFIIIISCVILLLLLYWLCMRQRKLTSNGHASDPETGEGSKVEPETNGKITERTTFCLR